MAEWLSHPLVVGVILFSLAELGAVVALFWRVSTAVKLGARRPTFT